MLTDGSFITDSRLGDAQNCRASNDSFDGAFSHRCVELLCQRARLSNVHLRRWTKPGVRGRCHNTDLSRFEKVFLSELLSLDECRVPVSRFRIRVSLRESVGERLSGISMTITECKIVSQMTDRVHLFPI
jgi:hypothetical protein